MIALPIGVIEASSNKLYSVLEPSPFDWLATRRGGGGGGGEPNFISPAEPACSNFLELGGDDVAGFVGFGGGGPRDRPGKGLDPLKLLPVSLELPIESDFMAVPEESTEWDCWICDNNGGAANSVKAAVVQLRGLVTGF